MPELPSEIRDLSHSSVETLRKCPERWRRRYLLRHYEPPSGPMVLGGAIGAAETQSDHVWIEKGEPLDAADVQDAFSAEWNLLDHSEIDYRTEKPAELYDAGQKVIPPYHRDVLPGTPPPTAAEREIKFDVVDPDDEDEIPYVAYLDLEAGEIVVDRKVRGKKLGQKEANGAIQPTSYLAARRAEGNPARGFSFHAMVRTQKPYAEAVDTERTDDRLDEFLAEIVGAAREIEWRAATDNWSYAPDSAWWCSETSCGYWSSCPGGGLLRKRAAKATKKAGKKKGASK